MYLKFCSDVKCPPLPVSPENLCRYAAYLARSRAHSTVLQYLNILRIVSLEFGLPNPLGSWEIKSLLTGVRRLKGSGSKQKLPILREHLAVFREKLDLQQSCDLQFWAACLMGFFGLLRVSNFTVSGSNKSDLCVKRGDISFNAKGCVIKVRHSKTNQFKGKTHEVALPYISGSVLCPTTALTSFLGRTVQTPISAPIFSVSTPSGDTVSLTQTQFRRKLLQVAQKAGLSQGDYNTHSLRRGGATWLLSRGTSLAMVKAIGDWSSDAVFAYLKPTTDMKFQAIHAAFQ